MNFVAFAALLSHWRRRPLQLLTLVMGIALATALWSGVQAINAEARASYARAASVLEQGNLRQIVAKDGDGIATEVYGSLRRAGLNVSPVIEGNYRFGSTRIRLVGIEPLTMPTDTRNETVASRPDLSGFFSGSGQLLVSSATAERLRGATDMNIKVDGKVPDGAAFVDISVADRLLDKHGKIDRLVVAADQKISAEAIDQAGLTIREPAEQPDVARLTDSFHLNLTAFGFLSFIVGLFIVYSATGLTFEQRRGTFRTLRSLGVSLRALTTMLLIELSMLALIAGLIGVILGYVIAWLLMPGVAATLRGLYGADVSGSLSIRPEWWLAGLAIALGGTAVSSAQSLWRVWKLPILAAAQPRAWARESARSLAFQAGTGGILLILAAVLATAASGLVAGFAVLGCLLLGTALVLPGLLAIIVTKAQRLARSALMEWFWADTRIQIPGLSLALMALLLALSANIGVGTMVSSFRLTFIGWLDQRLAAELYVTAKDEKEAARLRVWLPQRSRAVLPIWSVDGEVLGEQIQIFGVADDSTYREHWPLIASDNDVWDKIAAGQGALINEQMWRRGEAKIGQPLFMPGGWSATVVGVYSDYGNPNGQAIIGIKSLVDHYPDVPKLRYGVRVVPEQAQELKRRLIEEFGLPDSAIVDQASLKRQSRAIFDQTFKVTGALNVLTLGVAGFAMFSSLLTLSGIRLPQLAPVWAMGIRRRDLALYEVARTLALWLATFVAAIPVGLALAWVLLAIVNVEAFGWRLPMMVFPMDWLWLGAIALIAALLSVLVPVRRLASINPADLLRIFANER
ncbi:FtsX-like permease family protein [Rhizobium johnstonii]|uniref:Transmembrane FtsX-family attachment transporter-like protein n=1 Tax=Rhizobium johnstonii (strain DSM 114642 / LMG 32736 / 3841) TaxID=216596 RepID=Q1M8D4_RHIJ3|nr:MULTISPECIES: FtsX-like permease family protein [Rhizobium]MBB4509862.1 putative ABC transport system permease protein [Rhizobium leguminosarum]MBY5378169.1 FtsX-like permease family protein [Rhizobium leguminosarum]MBY5419746.1 FtsX-like permease family protein [Rhizobium leguminosarum]NEI02375.1 FtsX-like permease family protein [Rhizobium leguminosarum]NEI59212.1 FtsX-like permease family protein [Rhizobium leguminosarum]